MHIGTCEIHIHSGGECYEKPQNYNSAFKKSREELDLIQPWLMTMIPPEKTMPEEQTARNRVI